MNFETIELERADKVAVIRFNRPDRLNALTILMREEIQAAFDDLDEDPNVRVVVLTGNGRAFSAGADLTAGKRPETVADWYRQHENHDRRMSRIRELRKPTIAAINGICYGAGLILAAHCDLRVASEDARFSLIEARMGSAGAAVLPFLIGAQWTKFLALAGQIIDASKAKEIGLVIEVVKRDRLKPRVMSLAKQVAAMPPSGVFLNKRAIDGTVDLMGWAANSIYNRSQAAVTDSMIPEAVAPEGRRLREIAQKEGIAAFKQARDGAFGVPWLEEE